MTVELRDSAGAIVGTYNSIQQAENAASDGYSIHVNAASYVGNPEAVSTDLNGITFDLPVGITPTITMLESGNTLITLTGAGNGGVIGNSLANTIIGNAGDNVLSDGGLGGNDILRGLAGNDTYIVNNTGATVQESAGQGSNDRVATSVDYTLAAALDIELFTTTSTGATYAVNLTGNSLAQTIIGNAGANVLNDGGLGGSDILRGLGGNDTYIVNNTGATVQESAGQGTNDRVAASTDYTLAAGVDIELFTTTSTGATYAVNLTGNSLAQTIIGNAGDNVLSDGGLGGNDILRGLGGNDTYIVNNTGATVLESAGQGTNDRVAASTDYTLAAGLDIELFTTTSTGATYAVNLTGNSLAQTIIGNAGDNVLSDGGLGGNDILRGLGGNDTYIVNNTGATVLESAGQGTNDRVAASTDYTLAPGLDIELFTTTATGATYAVNLTGNSLAQTIIGNAGDNVLSDGGLGGNDILRGLGGNDTYIVNNTGATVLESAGQGTNDRVAASTDYTLAAGLDIELFTTTATGATYAVNLTGNSLAQTIIGNAGDNVLSDGGLGGNDILRGLGGNDTYIVNNTGATVQESAGQGTNDRVAASTDYTLAAGLDIELFTTTSTGATYAVNLTGNSLAQTIIGNAGDNVLSDGGLGGNDILRGLGGNDTYIVNNTGATVLESAGQGSNDRVAASTDYTLAAGVDIELFTTTSTGATYAVSLTGNSLAQTIIGNAGSNIIADGGGAGSDLLRGLGGNDIYIVRNSGTDILESASQGSNDIVAVDLTYGLGAGVHAEVLRTTSNGGTTNMNLIGNELGQTIIGNAGINYIAGRAGQDTLFGLAGNDRFVFYASDFASGVNDVIKDFHEATGDTDVLRLQGNAANYAFADVGSNLQVTHKATGGTITVNNFSVGQLDPGQTSYFV